LCDYSNQHSWDEFLRKPALAFLESLNSATAPNPFSEIGGSLWQHPSLLALNQQLLGAREISLFAPRLDNGLLDLRPEEGVLHWLLDQLAMGKTVDIHTAQEIVGTAIRNDSLRRALRHLEPWLIDGKLRIGKLALDESEYTRLPRVLTQNAGSVTWYTLEPFTPLFSSLLPEPVYVAPANMCPELKEALANTRWLSVDDLKPRFPVERFAFRAGEARNYSKIFSVLSKAYVEKMTVTDPYSGTRIGVLASLVQVIRTIVETIDCLDVHCREMHYQDKNYVGIPQLKNRIADVIKNCAAKTEVTVAPFHQHRQTHDRWLEFKLVASDGTSCVERFDLSGGIDYLMDAGVPSVIYRYGAEYAQSSHGYPCR